MLARRAVAPRLGASAAHGYLCGRLAGLCYDTPSGSSGPHLSGGTQRVGAASAVCDRSRHGAHKRWGEENRAMRLKHRWWTGLVAAVLSGLVGVPAVAAADAQFLPVLSVREGATRFAGIPPTN